MTAIPFHHTDSTAGVGRDVLLAARPCLHRYALWLIGRDGDLVAEEDALAAADLAMVRAWHRYRPGRGATFFTFARRWVLGAVRGLVRREVSALRLRQECARLPPGATASSGPRPDSGCLVHQLLARLSPEETRVLIDHEVGATALAEVARAHGRHPAWATRVRRRALARLRRVA
ncbi:MAG: sigma factor [Myxococcota bacterium]